MCYLFLLCIQHFTFNPTIFPPFLAFFINEIDSEESIEQSELIKMCVCLL